MEAMHVLTSVPFKRTLEQLSEREQEAIQVAITREFESFIDDGDYTEAAVAGFCKVLERCFPFKSFVLSYYQSDSLFLFFDLTEKYIYIPDKQRIH
jgi:hypothetical protein